MYKYIAALLLLVSLGANAQELNCNVKINYERVTDANTQIFKTLERSLTDFVNNTRWSNRNFSTNEKIECSIFFNIASYDNNNSFTATLQVQSARPVFNSTYSSPIFNFNDKDISFRYNEGETLFYNPNSYDSNLVSLLAYYSHIIIAMDADTYTLNGGTPQYTAAQNVASLAQQSGVKGWSQQDGNQNRYFLINDLLATTFAPYREALYKYHFQGLDKMADNQKEAKENIVAAIKTLSAVHRTRPNAFITRVFFDAKSDELVSIFSGGPMITVTELVENLNRISPLNSSKWTAIK